MTTHPSADAYVLEPLSPPDLPEVVTFLAADPVLNVYLHALVLRDALSRPRDEFWCARLDGRMAGVLFLGANTGAVLPAGNDVHAARRLGAHASERLSILPRRFQVIGPRALVGAMLEHFPHDGRTPRLARDQSYLSVAPEQVPPHASAPELRPARREDHAILYESGAALRTEELLEDPRDVDVVAYARRVEEDCLDGHTFIWRDAKGLCFRASLSALTPDAAQISGVYVPPERRGHGLATRGLGELCRRLFERSRAVCLFVNDVNAPAIAVYQKLGFTVRAPWASAFFAG